ncbi:2-succinyl-6-hydroxy-2,4-cyclohexadiene-1-carboxylate synthase [Otariodibacter oris]|uniref:2-succinyl-6-hydroxy-2,4-cyclohexadiene-1-carboxylate synthase n=1 Tax=Otariodibacter oris TaxID=1032623 RepID=A0A420XF82_9PAST|nr:2-succinyl-6-hydroxy-2,4-cyclohexadiene-1-carboxylate synthase [Otariodibacter oris]QGM81377.1 2-succinyl-6-hydroxy-2,4-cyclohexadiene-1-carboxylate synthase [Otariodibacter oris]RKR70811.1 2-succinyl-6-hydroxy-2,4-cyclohexadiene-1-carboxylate synthase [Otariodibacter oris]
MLAYQWHKTSGTPVVFLHGLLGSQQDWVCVVHYLQNIPRIRPLTLDLPFHAFSKNIHCQGFEDMRAILDKTLNHLLDQQPFWLVGYSLGGRIALDYTLQMNPSNLLGTILEGANIGLKTDEEKALRWENDKAWGERFRTENLNTVLTDWYHQPVFANLDPDKRLDLIETRQKNNDGKQIASMLEATSLAKQDFYGNFPWESRNIQFLIGEKDEKFKNIAKQYNLPYQLIAKAGHNTHQASPELFANSLLNIINRK